MGDLMARLDAAKGEVARLEAQVAAATCAERGRHTWVFTGGAHCGCHDLARCSVPVHECSVCGECDYGKNDEAGEQIQNCLARQLDEVTND